MAWIESHQTLRQHPKLYEVMTILKIDRPQAVGHLHLLWWWCVDYAPDGVLKHNDSQIARAAEWSGEPKKFVESLVAAKFIDRRNGVLTIHDWMDFCGALMERRLKRMVDKRPPMEAEQPPTNLTQPNQPNLTKPNQKHMGFTPPTFEEVKAYCLERKNDVEPVKFHAFYEANGWVQGRGKKIKNWQAAVRTWEMSRPEFQPPQKRPAYLVVLEYRALKWGDEAIKNSLILKDYSEHEIDEAMGKKY